MLLKGSFFFFFFFFFFSFLFFSFFFHFIYFINIIFRKFLGKTSHTFSHIFQTMDVEYILCQLPPSLSPSSPPPPPSPSPSSPLFKWVTEEEFLSSAISKGISFVHFSKSLLFFHSFFFFFFLHYFLHYYISPGTKKCFEMALKNLP